jgi:hypothetical protein
MLVAYPVLVEKPGEFVAQFKSTVVVQPRSTAVITGANILMDLSRIESEKSIQSEEVKALLAKDLWKKVKGGKK